MSVYNIAVRDARGQEFNLNQYQDKILLIVNSASQCRYTAQYSDLQKLYEQYQPHGLEIIAFPCNQFGDQEPGSNDEIQSFCQLNYGVTFPVLEKLDVRGPSIHPLFAYLTEQAPFEGFPLDVFQAKLLHRFLQEKFPALLIGDSIKWNFTKFLIDKRGNVVKRFESPVEPMDIASYIESLL